MSSSDVLDLVQIPLFAGLNHRQLSRLRGLTSRVQTADEALVIRQGTVGRDFVVLVKGNASVVRNAETVAILSDGDFFGEMAMLSGAPRNSSVIVEGGSDLLVSNPDEFRQILEELPVVAERLGAIAIQRLAG